MSYLSGSKSKASIEASRENSMAFIIGSTLISPTKTILEESLIRVHYEIRSAES